MSVSSARETASRASSLGLLVLAATSEHLRAHLPPEHLRGDVVARTSSASAVSRPLARPRRDARGRRATRPAGHGHEAVPGIAQLLQQLAASRTAASAADGSPASVSISHNGHPARGEPELLAELLRDGVRRAARARAPRSKFPRIASSIACCVSAIGCWACCSSYQRRASLDGSRAVEHGGALPGRELSLPACGAGAARVLERVLDSLEHRRPAATDQLSPGGREPRLGERELVAGAREDGPGLLGNGEELGARALLCRRPRVASAPRSARAKRRARNSPASSPAAAARAAVSAATSPAAASCPDRKSALAEIEPQPDRRVILRPEARPLARGASARRARRCVRAHVSRPSPRSSLARRRSCFVCSSKMPTSCRYRYACSRW